MTIHIAFKTGADSSEAICRRLVGGAVSDVRLWTAEGQTSAEVTIAPSAYEAARSELRAHPMVIWFHR